MKTYKKGSAGEAVARIQKALHLLPDGVFGPLTEEAVREFQRKHRLKDDGIVGTATLAALLPLRLKRSRRTINQIIVHCTATPGQRDYSVSEIRRWHIARGFSDIGYHYVIHPNGNVSEGRDVNIAGAHCLGHNTHSIGVCYVGGCATDGITPMDTRTPEQRDALVALLMDLQRTYPKARIYGHRDFANKACPSFNATHEYRDL